MKTTRSPRGKRFVVALLAITFGSLAAYSAKEFIIGADGKLSAKLGPAFNKVLLGASKLGMGLGELHTEEKASASVVPEGMIVAAAVKESADERPAGIIVEGEDTSLLAKGSKELRKVSRKAFISASKVEIYGK
jgi:hypothetical protein